MTTLRCVGLSLLVLLGLAVAGGCGAAGSVVPSYEAPPSYEALPSRPPVETGGGATDAYGQIRVDGSGFTHLLQLADAQTGEPIAGVRVLYAEQDGAGALLVQDATGTYPSTLTGLASEAPVQGTTYPSAVVAPAQIGPAQVGPAQVVPAEGVTAVLLPAVGRMHGRHGERASAPTTADLADALLREAVDEEVWVEVGVTRLDALRGALQGWFSSGGLLAGYPDELLVNFGHRDASETAWASVLLPTAQAPADGVADEAQRRYAAACYAGSVAIRVYAALEGGALMSLRLLPQEAPPRQTGGDTVTIRGRITDASTGHGLATARVEVTHPAVAHALTGADGVYTLGDLALGCESAAAVTVVVSKAGYGTRVLTGAELDLRRGIANTVNVALSAPLVLTGATPGLVPAADLDASAPWLDCVALPTADFHEPVDIELEFTGGLAPYRVLLFDDPWDPEDGVLPMGVSLHPEGPRILGNPVSNRSDGRPLRLTFRVVDARGEATTFKLQWVVRDP